MVSERIWFPEGLGVEETCPTGFQARFDDVSGQPGTSIEQTAPFLHGWKVLFTLCSRWVDMAEGEKWLVRRAFLVLPVRIEATG